MSRLMCVIIVLFVMGCQGSLREGTLAVKPKAAETVTTVADTAVTIAAAAEPVASSYPPLALAMGLVGIIAVAAKGFVGKYKATT